MYYFCIGRRLNAKKLSLNISVKISFQHRKKYYLILPIKTINLFLNMLKAVRFSKRLTNDILVMIINSQFVRILAKIYILKE